MFKRYETHWEHTANLWEDCSATVMLLQRFHSVRTAAGMDARVCCCKLLFRTKEQRNEEMQHGFSNEKKPSKVLIQSHALQFVAVPPSVTI